MNMDETNRILRRIWWQAAIAINLLTIVIMHGCETSSRIENIEKHLGADRAVEDVDSWWESSDSD